jgi:hypothetical protein
MSLDNLVGISLDRIEPDPTAIKRLLVAGMRSIVDANMEGLSNEARFDLAYKGILQFANAALQLQGFRTLTSKPGHHMTMLQVLPLTLGVEPRMVRMLDILRKQRQVVDYSGDLVSPGSVREAFAQAGKLQALMLA